MILICFSIWHKTPMLVDVDSSFPVLTCSVSSALKLLFFLFAWLIYTFLYPALNSTSHTSTSELFASYRTGSFNFGDTCGPRRPMGAQFCCHQKLWLMHFWGRRAWKQTHTQSKKALVQPTYLEEKHAGMSYKNSFQQWAEPILREQSYRAKTLPQQIQPCLMTYTYYKRH